MAHVRLVTFLAVCFIAVAMNLCSVSARPQFFFPGGIGAQTPVGGVSLGLPMGLSFNLGQQPVQQVPIRGGIPQQQQQQQQIPQQQQQYPQQQQQYPQQQQQYPQQQQQQQQYQPNVEHPKSTTTSEGLGSRFGGDPEPEEEDAGFATPDENPCQNMGTGMGNETGGSDDGGNATEQPCQGIGGGNRINPKQAALLSLVG
ncbi:uncharacterized protein DDB_G0283357-like [Anopheles funestus]|uniref:uncharacterized protein DDB_G0283357-like n=1 Tax=Anopheles funestus TaxID=62324 RepID=UPI0020C706E0|nr:uncharacterized protein DDB_G0283357-like [Anopheles funestus]